MIKSLTKCTGILCLWVLSFGTSAQYSLMPVKPPPYFTFNDLWHLSLIRSQVDGYSRFYLTLRVFNENGQLRIKSNSAQFSLEAGSHYYHSGNLGELQPFTTSYHDGGLLQQAVASGGVFPAGTYNMVYVLHGKAGDGEFVPLAEANTQVVVEAMWPPMLLSPTDDEVINTTYPLLTWTPAFSSTYSGSVSYTLRLVEVLSGQNAFQAIQANPVYFSQSNLLTTTLPYPAAAQVLDTGQVYAWQVHADAGGGSLGSSEIWTFSIAPPQIKPQRPLPNQYYKPAAKIPAEFIQLREAFLPVAIEERYHPAQAPIFTFKIYNERMEVLGSDKEFDAVINAGMNRYLVPVCSSEGNISLPKGKYFLEIALEKKIKQFLAFEIKETHCND